MPKPIILRGNSGSGKTTVSKVLQEKFGCNTMLILHDMVRMQILHAKDAQALPLIMELSLSDTVAMIYKEGKCNEAESSNL